MRITRDEGRTGEMTDQQLINWMESQLGCLDLRRTEDGGFRAELWNPGEGGPEAFGSTLREAVENLVREVLVIRGRGKTLEQALTEALPAPPSSPRPASDSNSPIQIPLPKDPA